MATSANRSSRGVNVRGGGASLGSFSTQALPASGLTTTSTAIQRLAAPTAISATSTRLVQQTGFTLPGNSLIQRTLQTSRPAFVNHPWSVIRPLLPRQRRSNDDALSISHFRVDNGLFVPIDSSGINQIRPEIVSLLDFRPIYQGESRTFNPVGRLLDVQYQAMSLRQTTLLNIANNIRMSPATTTDLDSVQTDFYSKFFTLNQLVDFYKNTINTLDLLKESLNVKTIDNSSFNTTTFLTLRGLYSSPFMSFPAGSFDKFTNTKVLYQLLFDFRSVLGNYSLNLLNLSDPDRRSDVDPIHIDKSYTITNGFSFTFDTIRSPGTNALNASDQVFFNRFQNSLPSTIDDRIKLLVTLLSKEFRVSAGLANPSISQVLTTEYNISPGTSDIFDPIIGLVGNTIFDPPTVNTRGGASFAEVLFLDLNANSFVLPFEKKYIDDVNAQKVYVPGGNYFIDSIVNITNEQFNTAPFVNYVQNFSFVLNNLITTVEGLFAFTEDQSPLAGVEVYKTFLRALVNGMTGLGTGVDIPKQNAATIALFRLACNDPQLKRMLFQFLLLLALKIQFADRSNLRFIFLHIVNEITDLTGLDFVVLDSNEDPSLQNGRNVQPFLDQLARDIQQRVFDLVGASSSAGSSRPQTPPSDPTTPPSQRIVTESLIGTSRAAVRPQTTPVAITTASTHGTRLTFDVDDNVTGVYDAMIITAGALFEGFVQTAGQLDIAASPGTNTSNYVDSNGRTNFNSLSATTLLLLIYEIFCDLTAKFASSDFVRSTEGSGQIDMIIDQQANDVFLDILNAAISEVDTVLTPTEIGSVSTADSIAAGGTVTPTGLASQGSRTGAGISTTTIIPQGSATSLASRITGQTNTGRIASSTGQSSGDTQASTNNTSNFTGNGSTISRTSVSGIIARAAITAANPNFLLEMANNQNSVFSIKQKIYEEDLIIANILHVLKVTYQRLAIAKQRMLNYFTTAKLDDFLNQSRTDIHDINNILNPAQVRIIVSSRDRTKGQLARSGLVLGQQVGFVSTFVPDENTINIVRSLLDQPEYRETTLADRKVKLITVGIPAGFSKNLADRVNVSSANRNFLADKEFDVIELLVYKRNLEHQELVFKPKKFIFDLSLFDNGYSGLNITQNQDFNSILGDVRLADYQTIENPIFPKQIDIDFNDKYSFLDSNDRHAMFKNHVVSNVLNSYITHLTAMNFIEEIFVDTTSTTFKTNNARGVNDLSQTVQAKIIRYLNVVQNKNLPAQTVQALIQNPAVDQDTKDTLRLISFGNLVFKPDAYMTRLLSPKLFDRVFTMPINVDEFQIDIDTTNATAAGREYLAKLQSNATQYLDTDSNGNLYLKQRDKNSVIFEDYFATIDLVRQ